MLASTKKPKATPLMEKFYNSIEYFEEVVQVDADSIPGSSEETKADRRDHQTKFYWRGHCKLPHTTAEVTGIITDKMGTSSNFSRHVKKFHLSEYEKWQQPLKIKPAVAVGPGQLSIAQAFQSKPKKYDRDHPRQILINNSIVKNLVVGCGLPHFIVENPKFRQFMQDVDALWDPISGRWIANTKLPELEQKLKAKLKHILENIKYVSVTLDIWSDRRMRGYLGITFHYIDPETAKLHSHCLGCFRMKGRHTAEAIFDLFHGIMTEFNLQDKIVRVISDNASNMRKAFSLSLTVHTQEAAALSEEEKMSEVPDVESDDESPSAEMLAVEESLDNAVGHMFAGVGARYTRMGCYNHALHNTVRDGLDGAGKRMEKALAKIQYFSSFAHKSGAFSEALDNSYGKEITLKTEVKTRWNYQYIAANHFMSLDPQQFDNALAEHGCKKLQKNKLTAVDRECTTQCCDTLAIFHEATLRTSSDKEPSITHVLPLTLGLVNGLLQILGTLPHASALINALLESMYDRFNGLLQLVKFKTTKGPNFIDQQLQDGEKFNDMFYLIAPFFDPTIKNEWVAGECKHLTDAEQLELNEHIQSIILNELSSILENKPIAPAVEQPALTPPIVTDTKRPKLLGYKVAVVAMPSTVALSPREEILQYLTSTDILEPEQFWYKYKRTYPLLYELYLKVLCVVASGSPVERVFSVAGNLFRPRRSRMGAKVLSALVFLKCNVDLLASVM